MGARIDEEKRKRIIIDYVSNRSYNAVAQKHGVSPNSVKNIVKGNAEFAKLCKEKNEQDRLDMIAYMESRKEEAQGVLDSYLKALADPEKIDKAPLNAIATAFGIVIDKFLKNTAENDDSTKKLDMLLQEFKDAVKRETD